MAECSIPVITVPLWALPCRACTFWGVTAASTDEGRGRGVHRRSAVTHGIVSDRPRKSQTHDRGDAQRAREPDRRAGCDCHLRAGPAAGVYIRTGAGNTVRTTLSNPGLFAYIGGFSAGTRDVTEEVEKSFAKVKANAKLYYVGCGTADKLAYENTKTLIDVLKNVGMSYQYREMAHGRWWDAWRVYLAEFVPQLFNQEARK